MSRWPSGNTESHAHCLSHGVLKMSLPVSLLGVKSQQEMDCGIHSPAFPEHLLCGSSHGGLILLHVFSQLTASLRSPDLNFKSRVPSQMNAMASKLVDKTDMSLLDPPTNRSDNLLLMFPNLPPLTSGSNHTHPSWPASRARWLLQCPQHAPLSHAPCSGILAPPIISLPPEPGLASGFDLTNRM